jgi:hypothetical protein
MKMVDLKLPKRSDKELKPTVQPEMDGDRWPYGMRLTFDHEQVDKLPHLEKLKVGQKVSIEGIGEITSISMNERQKGKEEYRVEVQLHEVGCEAKGKMHESMGQAILRSQEERKA